MKVEDLMVGDWLLDTRTGTPLRVNPFMVEFEVPEWQPIQLTQDILEKNGFRDSYADTCLNKDGVYNFSDWYGHSVIIDMNENELTVKCDNKVLVCLSYRNVIKVHELQQVLRLCDIKKEIII